MAGDKIRPIEEIEKEIEKNSTANNGQDVVATHSTENEVTAVEAVEEKAEEPTLVIKPKLLLALQWIIGLLAGCGIVASFAFIKAPAQGSSRLENYLWVIIFAIIMFGSRHFEKRLKKNLNITRFAMAGVVLLFVLYIIVSGKLGAVAT